MKTQKAIVSIALVALMIAVSFMAIPAQAAQVGTDSLITSGTLKIRGSSTVYPISVEAQGAYQSAHSGIIINVPTAEGSGVGMDALTQISGAAGCDMAASSSIPAATNSLVLSTDRNYWSTSITYNGAANDFGMADLRLWPIGKDSIAIVVAATNPYYNLIKQATATQISHIFTTAMNWNELVTYLGGDATGVPTTSVKLYTRITSSGTADGFQTFFLKPFGLSNTNLAPRDEKQENQDVLTAVSTDNTAIAYIGLGFLADNPTLIKGLWISAGGATPYIEPTKAHIYDNSYCYQPGKTIYRWLWYATNGLPMKGTDGALKTDFVNFVKIHPEYIDHAGYVRMLKSDFCGAAPSFASQDTAPTHPSLPDDKVNAADITYFVLSYIGQYDSVRPTVNPLCDYNGDHNINAADITQFVLGYIGYFNGGGF